MDDVFLREFVDLTKTCNFQETAENMFISTSTLSKHIRKMEEELGVSLFDRSTRTVSLSKYGTILLQYAQQIVSLSDAYHVALQNALTIEDNQLNIGFLPMLGRFGVLEFLSDFNTAYPSITMNIKESNRLEEFLLEQKFDFVFVDAFGPSNPRISKLVFRQDRLVAIFPKGHPLGHAKSVTVEQLRDEDFILQCTQEDKPTITAQNFLNHCQKANFNAKVALMTRHISTLVKLVAQGKGVGILYFSETPSAHHYECSVVDIAPTIPFDICVSYMPSHTRSESSALFLKYLKANAGQRQWGRHRSDKAAHSAEK